MKLRYGPHPSQFAELRLPRGSGRVPVAVIVHGGFWRTRYGRSLGLLPALDLTRRGIATLNVEYRRVGPSPRAGGGGWPETCLDVAAAVDLLAGSAGSGRRTVPPGRLDLDRVVAIGHSAGGHLAGWLAARPLFPADLPGARPAVALSGFVSQAGVLDLEQAAVENLGGGAVQSFLGGDPATIGDVYAAASPLAWLPDVPCVCVHGTADDVVPMNQSTRYLEAARAAGRSAELVTIDGAGHQQLINPLHRAWRAAREAALELLGRG